MATSGTSAFLMALLLCICPAPAAAQDGEDDEGRDADSEDYEDDGEYDDSSGGQRDHSGFRIDLHLMAGYYAEIGGGARFDLPVVSEGLIGGVDDDLTFTVGAEVMYIYWSGFDGVGVYPMLGLQWNFYVGDWSFFPEFGVTLIFSSNRSQWFGTFIAPHVMAGARYHLTEQLSVFVRAGWPEGVQLGLLF